MAISRTGIFSMMDRLGADRFVALNDTRSGLRAFFVIDSLKLGPAAGGIRTADYESEFEALRDAAALAHAMTLKCAIAGLPAGGAKTVVLRSALVDRRRAFRRLGEFIDDLKGLYRCAGDLGTTEGDLAEVASATDFVSNDSKVLHEGAGRGLVAAMSALAEIIGGTSLSSMRIGIQGCGKMGTAAVEALVPTGANISVCDRSAKLARSVADRFPVKVVPANNFSTGDFDILAPCAVGNVITPAVASQVRAKGVCGLANNQLSEAEAGEILHRRAIHFVPDIISSAGAVIAGLGPQLGVEVDTLFYQLGVTTAAVVAAALSSSHTPSCLARQLALSRLTPGAQYSN